MLDNLILTLFGQFPREVGNPKRSTVYDEKQLENFIIRNNGINDCFVSIYPRSGIIDKIFYDLDGQDSLKYAKILFEYLQKIGNKPVAIASGKKGIHVHIPLKPSMYENAKQLLTDVSYSILYSAFGKDKNAWKVIDSHIIGDLRRLCRIPNTLRPPHNRNYCVPLPQDKFLEMSDVDVANQIKSCQHPPIDLKGTKPKLTDFKINVDKDFYREICECTTHDSFSFVTAHDTFLENVLRPCLYHQIITNHPQHSVRLAATIDLIQVVGLNEDQIAKIYSRLNWEDWDEQITREQIRSCKKLKSYGCRKLRMLGVPRICCIE